MTHPVCVTVGAGPGNGAAFARRFAAAGHQVCLLARGRDSLAALETEVAGAHSYVYDATDADDAERVFAAITADVGLVETLIYNASSRDFADIEHTSPESFERAWRTGPWGCFLAARQVIPGMQAAGRGNIMVIGATAALTGNAGFVAFASAKAAQRSLAQSLARHLGPQGIHVAQVVIDAMVDMPASRAMVPDRPDELFARPEDIAESVTVDTKASRVVSILEGRLRRARPGPEGGRQPLGGAGERPW